MNGFSEEEKKEIENDIFPFFAEEDLEKWNEGVKYLSTLPGVQEVRVYPSPFSLSVSRNPLLKKIIWQGDQEDLLGQEVFFPLPLPYDQETVNKIREKGKEVLSRYGYNHPEITFREVIHERDLILVASVKEGKQTVVEKEVWKGDPVEGFPFPSFAGKPWDLEKIHEELRKWIYPIRERGYYSADVSLNCNPSSEEKIECEFTFLRGPLYEIEFSGQKFFFAPDLKTALEIDFNKKYTPQSLSDLSQNLKNFYISEGFPFVSVTSTIEEEEEKVLIHFRIEEGEKGYLKKIEWVGIPPSLQEKIEEEISLSPSLWNQIFFGKTGDLLPSILSEDQEKILTVLREEGYLDGKIVSRTLFKREDGVYLRYEISLGEKTVWKKIEWTGETEPKPEYIQKITPGSPLQIQGFFQQLKKWETELKEEGYLSAIVMGEIYPLQRGEAEGKVEVFRGTQFTLGGRKFTGSYTLKNSSLKKLFPPPSGPAQEKEKREREGTLTKSGAFQYLEGKFSPLDTPTGKVIEEFYLQEQPYGGGLEFGLVFSSVDGIGADFRLQYHRLFRTLRKSVLEGSFIYLPQTLLSREFQQPNRGNMNFHYEEPALFHHKVQGVLDLRWEINRTGKEFHYESYTLTLGPLFRLSSLWEVGTFYTFEAWRIFQVQFPEVDQEGKYLFGGILLTGTYQNLDTPYDPKEGYGLRQELQEVAPSLGGKFQYLLYQGKGIWLKPFFRRFSLVARPRWGYLFEWGDSSSAPRFKRFRLGGPSSLRGYQMERVSPWVKTFAGENVPIGGDRYGGYQSEIRTAITDRLDIAFFLDLLWIAYKKNGILGMGYGPGVLYHTPLGPLSLDLGFKGIPIPTDPSPYVVTFSFFTTL